MSPPIDLIWHQDLGPLEAALVAAKSEAVYTILVRRDMTLSCALASRLWARVFITNGIPVTLMQGFYEDVDEMIGHTWLELPSGALFDPTAAQFSSPGDPDCYLLTDSDFLDSLSSLARLDSIAI